MDILVVDDDNRVRQTLTQMLESMGHSPITARTGLEAIRLAEIHHPPVIILDGLLPEMHGFEIARHLRTRRDDYHPRIALMTAIYKKNQYQKYAKLKYGIDCYLFKPMTPQKLQLAIGEVHEAVA
ncbi:MAG: response regulator [Thermoanaerobaculia bacterium]